MCGTTLYVRPSDCHHFCDPSALQQRAALCCVGLRVRPLRRHPSAPHPQGTERLPMQPAPVVSLGAPFPRHRRLRVVSRTLVTLSRPSGQTRRRSRVVFRDCEIPRRLDGEAREAAVRLPCPLLPFVPVTKTPEASGQPHPRPRPWHHRTPCWPETETSGCVPRSRNPCAPGCGDTGTGGRTVHQRSCEWCLKGKISCWKVVGEISSC